MSLFICHLLPGDGEITASWQLCSWGRASNTLYSLLTSAKQPLFPQFRFLPTHTTPNDPLFVHHGFTQGWGEQPWSSAVIPLPPEDH